MPNLINWDVFLQMPVNMGMILAVIVCFAVILLMVWHRDSNSRIDLTDLLCRDGRLDEKKLTRLGAWIVSTWGFVYLVLAGKFTEWYFTGYMAIWVGNVIVDKYLNNKANKEQ